MPGRASRRPYSSLADANSAAEPDNLNRRQFLVCCVLIFLVAYQYLQFLPALTLYTIAVECAGEVEECSSAAVSQQAADLHNALILPWNLANLLGVLFLMPLSDVIGRRAVLKLNFLGWIGLAITMVVAEKEHQKQTILIPRLFLAGCGGGLLVAVWGSRFAGPSLFTSCLHIWCACSCGTRASTSSR